MLEKGDRFEVAERLLYMVLNDTRSDKVEGYVGMFENGREQGYRIMHYKGVGMSRTIAFSENRNSDDIVVYSSDDYEQGDYSEKFWQSARYFRYDNYIGAKEYIYSIMLGE
jgi:hypothetical protein